MGEINRYSEHGTTALQVAHNDALLQLAEIRRMVYGAADTLSASWHGGASETFQMSLQEWDTGYNRLIHYLDQLTTAVGGYQKVSGGAQQTNIGLAKWAGSVH